MKILQFDLESDDIIWKQTLQDELNNNHYVYDKMVPEYFVRSIYKVLHSKLKKLGFFPKQSFIYRKNLATRLAKQGLYIKIVTNSNLDLIFNTFTDLDDYTIAIDITIENLLEVNESDEYSITYILNRLNYIKFSLDSINKLDDYKIVLKKLINLIIGYIGGKDENK